MNNTSNTFAESANVPTQQASLTLRGISSKCRRQFKDMIADLSQQVANTEQLTTTTIEAIAA